MTATIAYDLPMKNLIDALTATGHVTRKAYRKTSVTLHHNAGRLSHEGVLNVWKVRPASAAFNIDRAGTACQYTQPNHYAWATGSKTGNQTTISIEMANTRLSPSWEVSEVTWKAACRLAGWLFAKIIGARPSKSNFFYHSHWFPTACAGPWMAKVYAQALAEAQRWYDHFTKATAPKPPTTSPSKTKWVKKDVEAMQYLLEAGVDGRWGAGTESRAQAFRAVAAESIAHTVGQVRLVQGIIDVGVDGSRGPATRAALKRDVKKMQAILKVGQDGNWGPGTDKAYLAFHKEWRGR